MSNMDTETRRMMNECYDRLAEVEEEIARKNRRLLKAVRTIRGNAFYINIRRCLASLREDCYLSHLMKYEIVRKATGKWQKEKWGREISGVWVDQWSEGDSGDSYSGFMYIEIKPNRYLRVHYDM